MEGLDNCCIYFAIVQGTLPWQLVLEAKSVTLADLTLFVALAFQDGLECRIIDGQLISRMAYIVDKFREIWCSNSRVLLSHFCTCVKFRIFMNNKPKLHIFCK